MKSLRAFSLIFLLSICRMTAGQTLKSTNSTFDAEALLEMPILYPKSAVDLILNFFQTYKRIKQLTLFLCENRSTYSFVSLPIQRDYYRNASSSARVEWANIQSDRQKSTEQKQHQRDGCLNFQQIVKYLMAAGNFLIKGDGNIDATMFTTSGADGCNLNAANEKFNSVYAYNWRNMLNSGDFKQGVVLDLRCRQSRTILQQVNTMTSKPSKLF